MNSERELTAAGLRIIELLGLKQKGNGRVDTSGGDKSPVGLARTLRRELDRAEPGSDCFDFICNHCRSNNLKFDAAAAWDTEAQAMVLLTEYDNAYCEGCEADIKTRYERVQI